MDAAFWEETHEGGTGAGLRNHEGNLLRAQSIWYETGLNARSLEAYAIRDGIQLVADLGYRKVIIESDAQQVIKQCNSPRGRPNGDSDHCERDTRALREF